MRLAIGLLSVLIWSAAQAQPVRKVTTCFEQNIAALRLSQLDEAISYCDQIAGDNAAPSDRRGQALAQRGLIHARRWATISSEPEALQGIQDITEGLQLHAPPTERKHHLLLVRGHLYAVVGQFKRAAEDYRAILDSNPANRAAWEALKKLTVSHGS